MYDSVVLTKSDAWKLVSEKLREMSPADDLFVVVDADTVERPFGWVFFYNSKIFLETGEFGYRLAGNGPAIVNKYDGSVEFFGTQPSPLEIIEDYERKFFEGSSRGV